MSFSLNVLAMSLVGSALREFDVTHVGKKINKLREEEEEEENIVCLIFSKSRITRTSTEHTPE